MAVQDAKIVSLSTAEAEYYSALEMVIEVLYLSNLLENMGFMLAPDTQVYEDYTACIERGKPHDRRTRAG